MAPTIDEPKRLGEFSSGGNVVLVSRDTPNEDTITVVADGVGIHSLQASSGGMKGQGAFATKFTVSSPAVTVIHSDQIQCTYVAASSKKSEAGKVLSAWSVPVERMDDEPEYSKLKSDTRISRIHATPALSDRIVTVHEDGKLSLVSSSLKVLSTQPAPQSSGTILNSWIFPAEACTFVSSAVGTAVVVVLGNTGETAWVSAVAVSSDDAFVELGLVELVGVDASSVVSSTCSEAGFLSILQSTCICTIFTLCSSTTLLATSLPSPLHFRNLSTPITGSRCPLAIYAPSGSILIFAGITTTSPPKLALLMWDTQYSTLLTERVEPLPSGSTPNSSLSLSGSTSKHLIITLSSTVLGARITLPSTTTIASALGFAHTSTHWLSPTPTTSPQDDTRTALVERIRHDVQAGRAAQADAAFFRWVEAQAEAEQEGTLASATKAAAKIPFPSAFAGALVGAAFPPEKEGEKTGGGGDGPDFASGVVAALIWRGAAGQGMVRGPGGLYGALRRKRDWPIMLSALQNVSDIPEDEIVATIYDLLIPLHASPTNPLTNPPTLQNGLAHLLAYPTSPTPLRLALRAHLRDAEDIVHVMKVLDAWLKRGIQFDVWELDGLQSVTKPGKGKNIGVSASSGKKKIKGAGMIPALEHILTFTQALLDTHLLTLLQHRPAHALLRSISASLAPLPAHNDALQTLAAPLAPFAAEDALERKTGTESGDGKVESSGRLGKEEHRKRRREKFAAEAIAIGEYRFEELVL